MEPIPYELHDVAQMDKEQSKLEVIVGGPVVLVGSAFVLALYGIGYPFNEVIQQVKRLGYKLKGTPSERITQTSLYPKYERMV